MKNLLFVVMILFLSSLYVHQALAQKQSHQEYAEMKISECNECHKSEGVAPNHDSDWVRGHRVLASKGSKNCDQCHP
ncbi:MAG TPA: cytochrome C, partial [Geobacteraceae bacterium]